MKQYTLEEIQNMGEYERFELERKLNKIIQNTFFSSSCRVGFLLCLLFNATLHKDHYETYCKYLKAKQDDIINHLESFIKDNIKVIEIKSENEELKSERKTVIKYFDKIKLVLTYKWKDSPGDTTTTIYNNVKQENGDYTVNKNNCDMYTTPCNKGQLDLVHQEFVDIAIYELKQSVLKEIKQD